MSLSIEEKLKALDFTYENSLVKIVANRSYQEIRLVGLTVGPFEEGNVYEVKYWVARELVDSGIAFFQEDELLDLRRLKKIAGRMNMQTSKSFVELPKFFYPKARRLLLRLKRELRQDPEKLEKLKKARSLIDDIYHCRRSKINQRIRDLTVTQQILENLTAEERLLYEAHKDVDDPFERTILDLDLTMQENNLTIMTDLTPRPIETH